MDANVFKVLAAVYAVVIWIFIHAAINRGPWVTVVAMLFASTVPMILTQMLIEHRPPALDPSRQSWSFLFGDAIILPLAGAMIALMARHNGSSFVFHWWWQVTAVICGLIVGFGFRLMDKPNYDLAQYNSPSKIVHEFVSFPVLASVLVWGLPLLVTSYWGFGHHQMLVVPIVFVLSAAGFGAMMAHDGGGLDTHYLHPEWNWNAMATISQ